MTASVKTDHLSSRRVRWTASIVSGLCLAATVAPSAAIPAAPKSGTKALLPDGTRSPGSAGSGPAFVVNTPPGGWRGRTPEVKSHGGGSWSTVTNWAGYAQENGSSPYTQVTDTFVVPTVDTAVAGTQIVSDWVGIGGLDGNDRLIQAGIQMVNLKGKAYYTAWTEQYPRPERALSLALAPGDSVTVTVQHRKPSWWLFRIQDGTKIAQRVITVKQGLTQGESVEAIEERPCVRRPCQAPNDFAHLAQTTNVTFDPGSFSTTPWPETPVQQPLLSSGDTGPNRFVMTDGNGNTLAVPSPVNVSANGFTVADGTSAPPPPGS
jgi:hypothetical protein